MIYERHRGPALLEVGCRQSARKRQRQQQRQLLPNPIRPPTYLALLMCALTLDRTAAGVGSSAHFTTSAFPLCGILGSALSQ